MMRLIWEGGEHDFALTIKELRALQDRCDAGPGHILNRFYSGEWRIDDVIETVRLGLMGGGIERQEAARLIKLHVEEKPLNLSVLLARVILSEFLNGVKDDPSGEQPAGEATGEVSKPLSAESGVSPASTGLGQ
jgi:hypothetical protein